MRISSRKKIYLSPEEYEGYKLIFRIVTALYELDPDHFMGNIWTYFLDTFKVLDKNS